MTVRSLDLLDIPTLARFRNDVLPLDTARRVTRGNPLGATAFLSYLNPLRNIYTAVATEEGHSLMGQIIMNEEETSARITFLSPAAQVNNQMKGQMNELPHALMEHLAAQAGVWGAFHILAEVDEDAATFRFLRQAGFVMYAGQRVWKVSLPGATRDTGHWRKADEIDWLAVQSLHGQIIPALLHPVEILPRQPRGMVCHLGDVLQAYVAVQSGPDGIWIQPLVPPDSSCGLDSLKQLVGAVSNGGKRPIYICVRSYQAWLETVLEDLGAEAGPKQAVMVKRLALPLQDEQAVKSMEKAVAKPAASVVHHDP
jgi:hypothetical protein